MCLDKRISYYDYPVLNNELKDLEMDLDKNKIDHPKGKSKDTSDAVAGCVYNLMRRKSVLKTSPSVPLSSLGLGNAVESTTAQKLRQYNKEGTLPGEFKVSMDIMAEDVIKCLELNRSKNPLLDD